MKPGEIWPQVLAAACIVEQFLKDADWVVGGGKRMSFSQYIFFFSKICFKFNEMIKKIIDLSFIHSSNNSSV